MRKFIGAIILLSLTLIAVFLNRAYMEKLNIRMNNLLEKAQINTDISDSQKYLEELLYIVDNNKLYLGAVCSEDILFELNKDINNAIILFETKNYDEISTVLGFISQDIQGIYKNELLTLETLF